MTSRRGLGTTMCLIGATAISVANTPVAAQSKQACDAFARNYAANASRQGKVLGGTFMGTVVGLGIGAATGGAALGVAAAVGGSIGAVGGSAARANDYNTAYARAFSDCMSGRTR